jgi:hypothetical protein
VNYRSGDLVDITIKGARVRDAVQRNGGLDLTYTYDASGSAVGTGSVWADAPSVTVESVAPSQWPPQAGDLWRDKHGVLWFASWTEWSERELRMHSASGGRWSVGHEGQLADNGPWTLVFREEAQS